MKVFVMGGWAPSLLLFRGHLLTELVARGHEVVAAAADGTPAIAAELAARGVRFVELPLQRAGMNPVRDARSIAALVALLRREAPDALFTYTVKPNIYGALAARLAGVPRVFPLVTGLGYAFMGQDRLRRRALATMVRGLYRLAFSRATTVLFQNPDDLREFRELGMLAPAARTAMINGSGVDTEHYCDGPPVTKPVVFLFIGRLLREKGLLEFVDAARQVKRAHPEVVFRVLGWIDPNPASVQQAQLDAWVAEGIIEYLGVTDDVRPHIAAASVLVLPSYREGTPRSVLEAMSMGRPIITTDAPGCRETTVDGDNGYLVPVGDAEALARAMERFIVEPTRIATMGRRSRAIAEEKYDVRKVSAAIIATIEGAP